MWQKYKIIVNLLLHYLFELMNIHIQQSQLRYGTYKLSKTEFGISVFIVMPFAMCSYFCDNVEIWKI